MTTSMTPVVSGPSASTTVGDCAPPTGRQEAATRTRQALIDAGFRLAEQVGLTSLSVNRIVEEAQVSKGTFFHHFGDRATYLLALHRNFHDRIICDTQSIIDGYPPGAERLLIASRAYLDSCQCQRGVRAMLLEARAEPAINNEVRQRNSKTAALIIPDFEAMDWNHPHQAAQLWVGMTAEAALIEFDAGEASVELRTALAKYVGASSELIYG